IGLSPDGSVLYHSDSAVHGVWAHDYGEGDGGSVSGRRFLVQRDDLTPDGLAVDEAGTVWVADVSGSQSVRGFSPAGDEVGRTTDVLRHMTPRLTAVEVDVELAQALAERLAGTNVEVVHADATDLPWPDDRFTAALSFIMLHHVPSPAQQDRLLAEVVRVLRP